MNVLESFSSIPRVKRLAAHVWRHFSEDSLFDEAASLSFTSLLQPVTSAVFPDKLNCSNICRIPIAKSDELQATSAFMPAGLLSILANASPISLSKEFVDYVAGPRKEAV